MALLDEPGRVPLRVARPLAVLAVGSAVVALLLPQPWAEGHRGTGPSVASVLAFGVPGVLLILSLLVGLGHVEATDEPRMWRRMSRGVACLAAAALASSLQQALAGRTSVATTGLVLLQAGTVVACVPFYHGLIHWNRAKTSISDPDDWLNGLGAVLVGGAIFELIVNHVPLPSTLAAPDVHAVVLATSCTVSVIGATTTVSRLAGVMRDPRLWVMLAGFGAATAVQAAALTAGAKVMPLLRPTWLLVAALIMMCPFVRPRVRWSRTASAHATSMGALVVLLGGLVVLIVHGELLTDSHRLVLGYACAGILASSARFVRLVRDLTSLAQRRREALTDDLTGLPNRRALMSAITAALEPGRPVSLLVLDLDGFKEINDLHGHAVGDEVLRQVGYVCGGHVPHDGVFGRLGSDEFAVLLSGAACDRASDIALSMREGVSRVDVTTDRLVLGVSIGVADADDGVMPDELMRRADVAMYKAKRLGGGIARYDVVLDAVAREQQLLSAELAYALTDPRARREQIVVHFQPQVNLATGEVVGAEALVRWQHPRLGQLAPDAFVHLADRDVLMTRLTGYVVQVAAQQALGWQQVGHRLRAAVNIPAPLLAHPHLLALLDETLDAGLEPELFVLEVTETSLMTDPERALAAASTIAERGIGLSIDDYGTAYSSLSYLRDLPASELKIDMSFTTRMATDPRTRAIVAATVELAHRLGMRIVIEGVETEAVRDVARELGCDEAQGYLYSRPLPARAFLAWLSARTPAGGASPGRTPHRATSLAPLRPAEEPVLEG